MYKHFLPIKHSSTNFISDLLDSEYQMSGSQYTDSNPLFRQSSFQINRLQKRGEGGSNPIQIPTIGSQQRGDEIDETEITISRAVEAFQKSLGLEDSSLLHDIISLREVPAGTYISKEDSTQVS